MAATARAFQTHMRNLQGRTHDSEPNALQRLQQQLPELAAATRSSHPALATCFRRETAWNGNTDDAHAQTTPQMTQHRHLTTSDTTSDRRQQHPRHHAN